MDWEGLRIDGLRWGRRARATRRQTGAGRAGVHHKQRQKQLETGRRSQGTSTDRVSSDNTEKVDRQGFRNRDNLVVNAMHQEIGTGVVSK